jgi:hypothetical protein
MSWYQALSNLFSIRDLIEIWLCATAIYYFSLWLKQDRQKNLLFSFYLYCALICGSYYAGLETVYLLLLISTPFAIMVFSIVHQDILQKNFIALARLSARPEEKEPDWLETLVRACLVGINQNKTIYGVIENKNSLAGILSSDMALHTNVQKNILAMAIDSVYYNQEKMIWLTAQGKLLGINAQWRATPSDIIVYSQASSLAQWQQEALFFTHKTDALVFAISPITRTFTLIAQGKIVEQVHANHAISTIKKFMYETNAVKGDTSYEVQRKATNNTQQNA